ncbi:MAG: anti-sigma F factor [Cellulosilyticaceae bacterium]
MADQNKMEITFQSISDNEAFARVAVAAFLSQLDPTVDELYDVKMAISEAVTNSIIHGYGHRADCEVRVKCSYDGRVACIEIIDEGGGIVDVEEAMKALFTTSEEDERAGLGFTVMQSTMNEVEVLSAPGKGTTVKLLKRFI